jgi:hypothetical protein
MIGRGETIHTPAFVGRRDWLVRQLAHRSDRRAQACRPHRLCRCITQGRVFRKPPPSVGSANPHRGAVTASPARSSSYSSLSKAPRPMSLRGDQRWMHVAQDSGPRRRLSCLLCAKRCRVLPPRRIRPNRPLGRSRQARSQARARRGSRARGEIQPGGVGPPRMRQVRADYSKRVSETCFEEENDRRWFPKFSSARPTPDRYVSDVTPSVRKPCAPSKFPTPTTSSRPPRSRAPTIQQPPARAFVEYITSAEGQAVLARHGLLPREAAANQPASRRPTLTDRSRTVRRYLGRVHGRSSHHGVRCCLSAGSCSSFR